MARAPTARRYAQAAFEIARDSGQMEAWAHDLQRAEEILQDGDLRAYLEVPKLPAAQKIETLRRALGDLNPLVVNLVALLTSRNMVGLLPRVAEQYQRLMDDHMNRVRAEVVTAVPLADRQQERLRQQLAQMLGKEVLLTTREDPDILGGLVARMGDRIIDGSVRGRLVSLRQSLMGGYS